MGKPILNKPEEISVENKSSEIVAENNWKLELAHEYLQISSTFQNKAINLIIEIENENGGKNGNL